MIITTPKTKPVSQPKKPEVERRNKVPVTIRLDADIVARFKTTGPGWQTKMNEALRAAKV